MNNNITAELAQMRSQLNLLKDKLNKQEIVNAKLIRKAMKTKMSWIEKYVWKEIFILVPFCALVTLPIIYWFDISWWWYAYTLLFVGLSAWSDYLVNIKHRADFDSNNLVEVARVLAWQKKMRIKQLYYEIPAGIIWLAWMFYGIMTFNPGDEDFFVGMQIGGVFGGAIGLVIGLTIAYNLITKMQRTNTELIEQIEDITGRKIQTP